MNPNKACPVVVRVQNGRRELLCFSHPQAGNQLVKGTIEPGESLAAACARELFEEAGIHAEAARVLGTWVSGYQNQVWGFYRMHAGTDLPDTWAHFTTDGGGHIFRFFWQPLDELSADSWHSVFVGAFQFIRAKLNEK